MSKIDPNANLYDIDGNLISEAPLKNKTIKEVEELVDELTKKVQDNPDNEVYKVYLNNAQAFLFGMYNGMSKEDLINRISALQSSVEEAKNEVNEAEQAKLEEANASLEELKESYSEPSETVMESISDEMDEYVPYEEIK